MPSESAWSDEGPVELDAFGLSATALFEQLSLGADAYGISAVGRCSPGQVAVCDPQIATVGVRQGGAGAASSGLGAGAIGRLKE